MMCGCATRHYMNICGSGDRSALPTQIKAYVTKYPDVDVRPLLVTPVDLVFLYPFEMRRTEMCGDVTARIAVGKDGNVGDVAIVHSSQREFEKAVLAGVHKLRFSPAKLADKTVDSTIEYQFIFDLLDE